MMEHTVCRRQEEDAAMLGAALGPPRQTPVTTTSEGVAIVGATRSPLFATCSEHSRLCDSLTVRTSHHESIRYVPWPSPHLFITPL